MCVCLSVTVCWLVGQIILAGIFPMLLMLIILHFLWFFSFWWALSITHACSKQGSFSTVLKPLRRFRPLTYRYSAMSLSTWSAMFRQGHWWKSVVKQWRPWTIPNKPLLAQLMPTLSGRWNHWRQLCSRLHFVFIKILWTVQWVPYFPLNNSISINATLHSTHQHHNSISINATPHSTHQHRKNNSLP